MRHLLLAATAALGALLAWRGDRLRSVVITTIARVLNSYQPSAVGWSPVARSRSLMPLTGEPGNESAT